MKYFVVLACMVVAVLSSDTYSDKYDNIDIKEILENKRLLLAYVDCIMERGKCSPEGKELKENLKDAIETGCKKCTERQERGASEIIDYLIKNERAIWKELCDKFDPEGKWRKQYEERAKAKGIEIPADK